MASQNNPCARENELVTQELNGELLLYDLNINKAYCLNPTSTAIWNLCDGNNSVSEITRQLSKKLKQPVNDELVWLAIDQFKTNNLLSHNTEIEIKFDGLSRREVLRKVGFASMIALPVISSLVAPTAAMAQSGGEESGECIPSDNTVMNFSNDCDTCQSEINAMCCSKNSTGFQCGDGGGGEFGVSCQADCL